MVENASKAVPFFRRGSGPLVSVLMATRGRPESLARAIYSLVASALDPSCIEIIVKVDEDDPDSKNALIQLCQEGIVPKNTIVLESPRGNGYLNLSVWYEDMAYLSSGDWLLIFSDDAVITTKHWDHILSNSVVSSAWHGIDDVCLLLTKVEGCDAGAGCPFPAFRRKVVELIGGFPPTPYIDTYLFALMAGIGAFISLPIGIRHEKPAHTPLIEEGEIRPSVVRYCRETSFGRRLIRDLTIVFDYFEAVNKDMVWTDTPPTDTAWYWWKPPSGGGERTMLANYLPGESFAVVKDAERGSVLTQHTTIAMGGKWSRK